MQDPSWREIPFGTGAMPNEQLPAASLGGAPGISLIGIIGRELPRALTLFLEALRYACASALPLALCFMIFACCPRRRVL
jgi:hypothetical protein